MEIPNMYYYMYGYYGGVVNGGNSGGTGGVTPTFPNFPYGYPYGYFPYGIGGTGGDGNGDGDDNNGSVEPPEEVKERPVGMVMTVAPNKTAYKSGEMLNVQGMVVELIYSSGAREITTNYDYYPKTPLTSDNTFMEVRCEGFSVRQLITVDAKADCNCSGDGDCTSGLVHEHTDECEHPEDLQDIRSISVSKPPVKKVYAEGEIFDPAGMEITGTTADGDQVVITSYEIETRGPLSSENKEIKVKYKNLSTDYNVNIVSEVCINAAPATETAALVESADGKIYLGSGKFSTGFTDIRLGDGNLSANVSHVYKSSGAESCCGSDWRLNLHCSLKRLDKYNDKNVYTQHLSRDEISKTSGKIDYISTDGAGNRHAFHESVYYIERNERKQA